MFLLRERLILVALVGFLGFLWVGCGPGVGRLKGSLGRGWQEAGASAGSG